MPVSLSTLQKFLMTMGMAMVPVVELRGAIPFGVSLGLTTVEAFIAGIIGNILPVPFILILLQKIFMLLRRIPKLRNFVHKLEDRAHIKGELVRKYSLLGLFIIVAIPIPGTGAWTGALIASVLRLKRWPAFAAIAGGVIAAGVIVFLATHGVVSAIQS